MRKYLILIFTIVLTILFFSIIFFLEYLKNLSFETEKDKEVITKFFYKIEITRLKTNVTYIRKFNNSYPIGIEIHEKNLLTFGLIPIDFPIERVRRFISLENLDETKAKIKVFCRGNICKFLNISRNNFILNPKEKTSIEISAENKKIEGYFEGYVYINIFKPKDKIWEFIVYLV